MSIKVLAMGGDGIGPEVVDAALQVLEVAAKSIKLSVDLSEDLLHGASWEQHRTFLRPETLDRARQSDALLVGATGGPQWDHIVIDGGPEEQDGLMKLRHELQVFACLRHARAHESLLERTAFKPEVIRGADVMVMRELCGGAMFTPTCGIDESAGSRRGYDLNEYTEAEIERFARVGFEVARRRRGRLLSIDKSNVFMASKLWREVVDAVGRREFADVELTHFFTDNAAYQLCCRPADFDVILADHLDVSMQYGSGRMDLSLARHQRLDKAAMLIAQWLLNGTGPGSGAFFSATLFHALEDPALPEFEVFMTPMVVDENLVEGSDEKTPLLQRLGRRLLVRGRKVARPGVQIDINLERPCSLGSVRLASADPRDHPLIDPNFLADEQDLHELLQAAKAMRAVMARPQIAKYLTGELGVWKGAKSDAGIIEAIRATAYTGHHPCSTARMGADPGAVLDEQLRVTGVDSLRVCDAAAMPTQITGNPNATVIAMAEKAADMILEREPLPAEDPRSPS